MGVTVDCKSHEVRVRPSAFIQTHTRFWLVVWLVIFLQCGTARGTFVVSSWQLVRWTTLAKSGTSTGSLVKQVAHILEFHSVEWLSYLFFLLTRLLFLVLLRRLSVFIFSRGFEVLSRKRLKAWGNSLGVTMSAPPTQMPLIFFALQFFSPGKGPGKGALASQFMHQLHWNSMAIHIRALWIRNTITL